MPRRSDAGDELSPADRDRGGEELPHPRDDRRPDVVRRFGFQSGRDVDKFADFPYEPGENGCPILPDAKAFWECPVVPELTIDLGTHTMFVATVDRAGVREGGEPLTYNEYRKTMRKRR